jgi:subtilisin family serine protease
VANERSFGSSLPHAIVVFLVIYGTAAAQSPGGELSELQVVSQKYGLRGVGQSVAIIDSGIAYNHVALGGGLGPDFRVVGGKDFTGENDANPYDDPGPKGGHGTQVSSVVGFEGDLGGGGGAGVAPDADLVGLRVFDDAGAGYLSWIETALKWVHTNRNSLSTPITTVNLSLGAAGNTNSVPTWSTIEDELAQLKADGIFIAASAGNDFTTYNQPGLAYPASSPNVVPVMSVDDGGGLSYFSQRHARAIGAPGRLVNTAIPDYLGNQNGIADDFAPASGTDIAAPYLAGASVIVREAMQFVGTTTVTQQTIYDHIYSTADVIFDPITNANYHVLNLDAAIDALMPADDVGSTLAAATNLGTVANSKAINGLVGTVDDVDFFRFTAGSSGTARLVTSPTHYLVPEWTIQGPTGGAIHGALDVSFSVVAGQSYSIALATGDAIGYYQATLTLNSGAALTGDYNGNGKVDAGDYVVWRNTLGSTTDRRADGNLNGVVDAGDYNLWKQFFGQGAASGVPEPTSAVYLLILSVAACGITRRRARMAQRTTPSLA